MNGWSMMTDDKQQPYKKILVLGSSGQIGGHLIKRLRALDYEVIEFDIQNKRLEDLRFRNNFYLSKHMSNCDFVFFLAFDVGGSKYLNSNQNKYSFLKNNTDIISNTFESLKLHKKPFVFVSSQLANNQDSSYGIQKRLGEFYTYSLEGIVTRLWNVYGIEEDNNKSHVISDIIRKALKYPYEVDLLTNGKEKRQFLHADDCSDAFIALMENYNQIDKAIDYHITSYEWTSIAEVADLICNNIEDAIWRPGDKEDLVHTQNMYEPNKNISSIWKPKIDLQSGILQIINHYRNIKSND